MTTVSPRIAVAMGAVALGVVGCTHAVPAATPIFALAGAHERVCCTP